MSETKKPATKNVVVGSNQMDIRAIALAHAVTLRATTDIDGIILDAKKLEAYIRG